MVQACALGHPNFYMWASEEGNRSPRLSSEGRGNLERLVLQEVLVLVSWRKDQFTAELSVLPKSQLRWGLRTDHWVSNGDLGRKGSFQWSSWDEGQLIEQAAREERKLEDQSRQANIVTKRNSKNIPLTIIY